MLCPVSAFNTDKICAVTALKACNIFTADETEFAVVAKALALRAVFLTVWAYYGTFLAGTATLTDKNTFRAQIAAFAECIGTFTAYFTAPLAKDSLITAFLTAGAMVAVRNGTFDTKLTR